MNKLFYLLILLFISNCSLDTKTGFWSKSKLVKSEVEPIEKKLFVDKEIYEKEFNPELKIRLCWWRLMTSRVNRVKMT